MFLDWKDVEKEHVLYLLTEVRQLFSNQEKWIDYPSSVDLLGQTVNPDSEKAVKWNLLGATELLSSQKYNKPLCDFIAVATREYLNFLSDDKLIKGTFSYDDELALIDLGIEELKQ